MRSAHFDANYQSVGVLLLGSTPMNLAVNDVLRVNGTAYRGWCRSDSPTSRSGVEVRYIGQRLNTPYLRCVMNSARSVKVRRSADGRTWTAHWSAEDPGFDVAGVGICISGQDTNVDANFLVDWIRFDSDCVQSTKWLAVP